MCTQITWEMAGVWQDLAAVPVSDRDRTSSKGLLDSWTAEPSSSAHDPEKAQEPDTPHKPWGSGNCFKISEVHAANKADPDPWKGRCRAPSTSTQRLATGRGLGTDMQRGQSIRGALAALPAGNALPGGLWTSESRSHLILQSISKCSVTFLDSSS